MTDSLRNVAEQEKPTRSARNVSTPSISRKNLLDRFREKIILNPVLDRTLVSFQANKRTPFYSWFKYREGFSQQLVHYLVEELRPQPGTLLDPFSGGGSALYGAAELGWKAKGIEVLPVGVHVTNALMAVEHVNLEQFIQTVERILSLNFADYYDGSFAFIHIPITQGAYPEGTERELIGYIAFCSQCVTDQNIKTLLLYAAFCVLEDISYTRKDGQFLRWDARSGRSQGKKPFYKDRIYPFREAIERKLHQMIIDLTGTFRQTSLFTATKNGYLPHSLSLDVLLGSCLDILPEMPENSIDFVLTSPPYANRYDYTRTYALELVYLGYSHEQVRTLRQSMLSCTVENKDKRETLERHYQQLDRTADFIRIDKTFRQQEALQEVLTILNGYRDAGTLNNPHIARLVQNYFYEMCFVTFELARILQPGGVVAMVNDNVRYAGEEIPVDLILSDVAETFGLTTRCIWILSRGKGNSSQQMGSHGRTELRKCVYIWEKR